MSVVVPSGPEPSAPAPRPNTVRRDRVAGGRIWDPSLIASALRESFVKLDPRLQIKNPVMFVVEIGSLIATVAFFQALGGAGQAAFVGQVAAWLWFTVLFANFAEAMAEARGRAQADTLRRTRKATPARLLRADGQFDRMVSSFELRRDDLVLIEAGDLVPGDGEVIDGIAYVNEAAITGESAPVLKEPGTDTRSSVTGGTEVISDWLKVRITANPGETFLDRMIGLVEGARRQKTPNEIALWILLSGLTIVFLLAVASLQPFAVYSGGALSIVVLIALLVCLIPTTIGGLLSAIGIAGMDRVTRFNVLAMSGRAVEAAGDVDTLLLDKTGTVTFGNRLADQFLPVGGCGQAELVEAAYLASLGDDTPEGKSILTLARRLGYGRGDDGELMLPPGAEIVPFSAETRLSGMRDNGTTILKGAVEAVAAQAAAGPALVHALQEQAAVVAREGGTPLAVSRDGRLLGVVYLKDTVKPGLRERIDELRRMGIRSVMITGDNPLTAATIAREAGFDDFVAEARPEDKLRIIREQQSQGHLVAMTGDGTNDAPALAQADVGLAMNSGTAAAKEAANMVDLDSDPTKLIEVVMIGKQLLITRGAITTFSVANDVAKYFAIVPAAFAATYPALNTLNVMQLATPTSAILSAVIFNALIIIALVPLSLRGVQYRAVPAGELLFRNLMLYGLGGIVAPFIGIKLIDLLLVALSLA